MARLARIAVIGCGSHAVQNLYPSFRLSVLNPPETGAAIGELAEGGEIGELVACCDLDDARARRAARDFGIGRYYTDHRTLLERERPDGVVIAMHPRLQPAVARDCLEAGAHAFLEKPPAETIDDCLAIRDAAERGGQVRDGRFHEALLRALPPGAGDRRVERLRRDLELRGPLHVRRLPAARRLRLPERLRVPSPRSRPVVRGRRRVGRCHPAVGGRRRPRDMGADRARAPGSRVGLARHVGGWPRAANRRRRRRGRVCSASRTARSGHSR